MFNFCCREHVRITNPSRFKFTLISRTKKSVPRGGRMAPAPSWWHSSVIIAYTPAPIISKLDLVPDTSARAPPPACLALPDSLRPQGPPRGTLATRRRLVWRATPARRHQRGPCLSGFMCNRQTKEVIRRNS